MRKNLKPKVKNTFLKSTCKCFWMLSILIISWNASFAQVITVKGKVTTEEGITVPFASVSIKGTKNGVSANADGDYSIVASDGLILVFTATGYIPREVTVTNTILNVVLSKSNEQTIEEVVVTAYGVKSVKRAVNFAVQDVSGKIINQAGTGTALNALTGKIAGLEISNSSGTPGAATFMKLRGFSTLSGSAQPLIVVDGMPIDNSTRGASLGNVAQSNRAIDLNPDDIENVSVLKGPSASALYGTKGTDGVILITTKRGKRAGENKFDISYGYGVAFDNVSGLPPIQMLYGKGSGGNLAGFTAATSASFGPRIDTLKWTGVANEWDPHGNIVGASDPSGRIPFVPYNNQKQFFRTGITQQHNVSLASANSNSTYRVSYSNLNQTGIIPLSTFTRHTITLTGDTKLSEKLKTGVTLSYINSGGDRIQEGSNTSGLMLGLARSPITFDNSYGQKDPASTAAYLLSGGNQRTYRGVNGAYDNPYFTINKNKFKDEVNRTFGNIYLTYSPNSNISITDRLGTDVYTDNRKQYYAIHSALQPTGQVIYTNNNYRQITNDLLINVSKSNVLNGVNANLSLGNNIYSEKASNHILNGTELRVADFYDMTNASVHNASNGEYQFRTIAFFGDVKFDINNFLYLGGTGRFENSSNFISAVNKRGVWSFFPSANIGFIFTDAFNIDFPALNHGKIRFSYGQAGKLPGVYNTETFFSVTPVADGWVSGNVYPIGGQIGFFGGVLGTADLKPERTGSIDLGADLRFFNNRLELNFTHYITKSKDLLLFVPLPFSSGYGSKYRNAGSIENRGIELTINATPVKKDNLEWNLGLNWSKNRSKVTALGPGVETLFLGGFVNGAINAVAGKPYGQIYGVGYVKDPATGKTLINNDQTSAFYGYPIINPNSVPLGDPNPDWIAGLNNNIMYKNFSLAFLFDTKQGFDIWNGTRGALVNFGTAKETETRGQEKVFDGILGHVDADGKIVSTGTTNNITVKPGQAWYQAGGGGFNVNEPFIEDGSFIRFKEASLAYRFNFSRYFRFIKTATLSVVARNLITFTKYKGVDPDTGLAGAAALGIDYFNNPSTRTFGFNCKFDF